VYSVTELSTGMDPDTNAHLKVRNIYGFDHADVLVLAEKKDKGDAVRNDKITCAVMQVRDFVAAVAPETKPGIDHKFGSFVRPWSPTVTEYTRYNKVGGLGTLTTAQLNDPAILSALDKPFPDTADARFKFGISASIMNLGQPVSNTYGMRVSTFTLENGRLLENGKPVVDGIVYMEAQLGKAASPTATAVSYIKNMPMDPSKDPKVKQSDWFSLRTVRIVLIARVGQYEKEEVSPASYTFWGSPDPHGQPVTYIVPPDDRHYRHQAIELVIPLRNMFWRPQ
jgi:hypothetical protein